MIIQSFPRKLIVKIKKKIKHTKSPHVYKTRPITRYSIKFLTRIHA